MPNKEEHAQHSNKLAAIYCNAIEREETLSGRNHNYYSASNGLKEEVHPDKKPPSHTSMSTADRSTVDLLEAGMMHNKEEGESFLPRLVLRNRPYGQSTNKIHISHNQGWKIFKLLKHNWFHALLRWPTSRSLSMLMSIWTGAILVFAVLYVWQDNRDPKIECGLGDAGSPIHWAGAFAFSLETCTTVGYGLPSGANSFFESECGGLQVLIYFQMAWSMLFNAFLLAFLYARFGRSETRSNQVINSRKALVSCVDGQVRFQVRLFDADAQHPVVEAHVRMYCVMNHRPVPRPLRLLQPDDELGGMLFLSFPTIVSHHIDLYSLMHPPTEVPFGSMTPSGLVLRQVDGATSNRDDVICPVCGESYGTIKRWKNHVRYQQIVESKDDYPVAGTHLSLDLADIELNTDTMEATNDISELKEYFRKSVSEIICVVEGIDPLQSGTFQSLQSYRFEDIVWDANSVFAPCMTVTGGSKQKQKGERMFQVDLDRYHDIKVDEQSVKEEARRKQEEEANAAAAALVMAESSTTSEGTASNNCPGHPLSQGDDSNSTDPLKGPAMSMADLAAAAIVTSNSADAPTVKKRHRRIKSSSRRPGDALFVPLAAELELGNSGKDHPFGASKSMPI